MSKVVEIYQKSAYILKHIFMLLVKKFNINNYTYIGKNITSEVV